MLRLTSGNCTAKSVLENVFQNDTLTKSDKFKNIQNVHHHFACILRYDGQNQGNTNWAFFKFVTNSTNLTSIFQCEFLKILKPYPFLRAQSFIWKSENVPWNTNFYGGLQQYLLQTKVFCKKNMWKVLMTPSSKTIFISNLMYHTKTNMAENWGSNQDYIGLLLRHLKL